MHDVFVTEPSHKFHKKERAEENQYMYSHCFSLIKFLQEI